MKFFNNLFLNIFYNIGNFLGLFKLKGMQLLELIMFPKNWPILIFLKLYFLTILFFNIFLQILFGILWECLNWKEGNF
jgi:Zn-dependent protease